MEKETGNVYLKRFHKSIFAVLLMMMMLLFVPTISLLADELPGSSRTKPIQITVNKLNKEGKFLPDRKWIFYKVNVTQTGTIDFEVQAKTINQKVSLMSYYEDNYFSKKLLDYDGRMEGISGTIKGEDVLIPGTYYFRVGLDEDIPAETQITVQAIFHPIIFDDADFIKSGSNNSYENSQMIEVAVGKTYHMMLSNMNAFDYPEDNSDWMKFEITDSKKIIIHVERTDLSTKKATLFLKKLNEEGDMQNVGKWEMSEKSLTEKSLTEKTQTLEPGQYFLQFFSDDLNGYDNEQITYKIGIEAEPLVTDIILNKSSVTLASAGEGTTVKLSAKQILPETAQNKKLKWTTSNKKVAKVDGTGKVTAVAKGSATITAKATDGSNVKKTCKIKVIDRTISLTKKEVPLIKGDVLSLNNYMKINPAAAVKWASGNTKIVKVSTNGKLTAVKAGKATVTVMVKKQKELSAKCSVIVKNRTIKLNHSKLTLYPEDSETLSMEVTPEKPVTTYIWSSDKEGVVKVDSKGKLTAVGPGTAKITVKANDKSGAKAVCTITVKKRTIKLGKTKIEMKIGEKKSLKVTVKPKEPKKGCVWKSSDTKVAVVDKKTGIVKAVGSGTAQITVETNEKYKVKAVCTVKVEKRTIKLDATKIEMKIGEKKSLKVTVKPTAPKEGCVWKSSNTKVAVVDKKTGKVKAVGSGTAQITVETNEKYKVKAVCTVKVKKREVKLPSKSLSMRQGDSQTIKVTVDPKESYELYSENSNIVEIKDSGKIYAVGVGTTNIYAKSKSGVSSEKCFVEVKAKPAVISPEPPTKPKSPSTKPKSPSTKPKSPSTKPKSPFSDAYSQWKQQGQH